MKIPWLPKKKINKKAEGVITDYELNVGLQEGVWSLAIEGMQYGE
jgi:hypothetical protein